MIATNGNGHSMNGGSGGDAPTLGSRHICEELRLMGKVVTHANTIADKHIQTMIDFCERVAADPDVGMRERLRAHELMKSLADKGVDVAMYLDKRARMDAGKPTEIVDHRTFTLEFDDRT